MLTSAEDAIRGEEHVCPSCSDPVTLRRGDVRVAQRPGTNCSPESAIHKIVKLLIAQVIHLNALGSDQAITIEASCELCDSAVVIPHFCWASEGNHGQFLLWGMPLRAMLGRSLL
jgi:hypothetical protein